MPNTVGLPTRDREGRLSPPRWKGRSECAGGCTKLHPNDGLDFTIADSDRPQRETDANDAVHRPRFDLASDSLSLSEDGPDLPAIQREYLIAMISSRASVLLRSVAEAGGDRVPAGGRREAGGTGAVVR